MEHLINHHEKKYTMGALPHMLSSQKKQGNTKIIPFIIIGIEKKTVIHTELCMIEQINNMYYSWTIGGQIVPHLYSTRTSYAQNTSWVQFLRTSAIRQVR